MPFGEPSSNSYGTSSGTTMMNRRQSLSDTQQQQSQQQSQPPLLRSRQAHNSRAGSHSPTSSDLLFSHPQSSFDEFPYPPYSELPFTALKRRKQLNAGNQFVKWAMRSVLASPVIVLVFWSIGAMMFSKNVSHKVHRNTNKNSSNGMMSARMMRRMADSPVLPQGAQPIMTPYGLLMPLQQQAQPMYGMAPTITNDNMGYTTMATPQQQQQQQQQPQMQMPQQGFGMAVPRMQQLPPPQQAAQQSYMAASSSSSYNGMAAAPAYGSSTTQTSYDLNPMMVTPENPPPPPPLAATTMQSMPLVGNGMVVQPQALQQAEQSLQQQQQQLQQMAMEQPQQGQMMMPPPQATQAEPFPLDAALSQELPQSQQSQPQQPKTTILYYDPKQTYTGTNGEVRLPTVVYDTQGHPIDLASFSAQDHAQIFLEAPLGGIGQALTSKRSLEEPPPFMGKVAPAARKLIPAEEVAAMAMGDSEPGATDAVPPRTLMEEESSFPESQLATPTLQKWGQSTAQDQNIIVATVAVMALLVGALSARRLRSRSVLSACIENESLEDDVAYDTAYSTNLNDGSSSYNTFGGGGWKGDLEKFDV